MGGCFDLIHFGHVQFLKKARSLGQKLVVLLESDEFIRKNKGHEPIHSQQERAQILLALRFVDRVVELPYLKGYDEYLAVVKKIQPQVIVVTKSDSKVEYKNKQAKEIGAKVVAVTPRLSKYSTSVIREVLSQLG